MQLVDYRVSNRGPFPEFLLYFRQTVVRTTHLEQSTKGRNNPPKVGATHGRCASPPLCLNLVGSCMESLPGRVIIHSNFA